MDMIQHISEVQAYCRDHLGIKLDEYWLTKDRVDLLRAQLREVVLVEYVMEQPVIIISGMTIKTVGVHGRKCRHLTKSHFQDVGEVYCHDCRTIIGEQIPTATHRRSSNVGPQS